MEEVKLYFRWDMLKSGFPLESLLRELRISVWYLKLSLFLVLFPLWMISVQQIAAAQVARSCELAHVTSTILQPRIKLRITRVHMDDSCRWRVLRSGWQRYSTGSSGSTVSLRQRRFCGGVNSITNVYYVRLRVVGKWWGNPLQLQNLWVTDSRSCMCD